MTYSKSSMLDPDQDISFSYAFLFLCGILTTIVVCQFWGYYPNNLPNLTELHNPIGEMVRAGELNHPIADFFRKLPFYTIWSPDILGSPRFNFVAGFLTKLILLTLTFVLLKRWIKNDLVILFVIILITIGFYYEPHPFRLALKYPTFYNFRQVASLFVLGSVFLIVQKRLIWAGFLLGVSFFLHPKIGGPSIMMLGMTTVLIQYFKDRSLSVAIGSSMRILIPAAAIIYGGTTVIYYGNYFEDGLIDFPTYMMALKLEPDDYFFFDRYQYQTPALFEKYSPLKFIGLMIVVGFSSLAFFWNTKNLTKPISEYELFIVLVLYCFLLYFSRLSPEILLYLGLINTACYVRYICNREITKCVHLFRGNPVGLFSLVLTTMFLIGVAFEYVIGFLPGWLGPMIYTLKIYKVLQLNTLIGTIFLGVIALRVLDLYLQKVIGSGVRTLKLKPIVIGILLIFVVWSGYVFDSRTQHSGVVAGFGIYRSLLGNDLEEYKRYQKGLPITGFIYEEKRISGTLSSDKLADMEGVLREINQSILNGDIDRAEKKLASVNDESPSSYLSLLRANIVGNLLAAKGKLHAAHRVYLSAQRNTIVLENEYPILLKQESYEVQFPEKIPNKAYVNTVNWILENTATNALFLNPPYIDRFSWHTRRSAFFPSNKAEVTYTPFDGRWAETYLQRQRAVLEMTVFDLPGIPHGNLSKAAVRYAFLHADYERIEELRRLYPGIDYIFTESRHILPYSIVFSNEYFVIYDLS